MLQATQKTLETALQCLSIYSRAPCHYGEEFSMSKQSTFSSEKSSYTILSSWVTAQRKERLIPPSSVCHVSSMFSPRTVCLFKQVVGLLGAKGCCVWRSSECFWELSLSYTQACTHIHSTALAKLFKCVAYRYLFSERTIGCLFKRPTMCKAQPHTHTHTLLSSC